MSPHIENLKIPEQPNMGHFVINLSSEEPFNAAQFDKQAVELQLAGYGASLKYIVLGDKLFAFPFRQKHDNFYNYARSLGEKGQLQSAGNIVVYNSGGRIIKEYSSSLERILSEAASNEYKMTTMKDRLGEFFEFE